MSTHAVRALLFVALVLGLLAGVRVIAWPLVPVELPPDADPLPAGYRDDTPRSLAPDSIRSIVSRNPFRISRRAAQLAYDPARLAEHLAPPPPRPELMLAGVISAAQSSAVVEGLPGISGARVVRVGDVIAGLRIREIVDHRVVIVGMDTTWILEVKEPWKH